MKRFLVCLFIFCFSLQTAAQSCFADTDDTTITLNCSDNCTNLKFKIPDLRNTSEYKVISIPYDPLPFTDRNGTDVNFSSATVWPGNSYSDVFDLPFGFCFFGSVYNSLVIGANGTISFDASMAKGWCEPLMLRANSVFPLPSNRYARAMIAAVMHDLDPGDTARVSSDEKVEYRVEGNAPCRKIVISYFNVPLWPVSLGASCQTRINTHQVILYEGTGIIDVFIKDAPTCPASNGGRNMLGIQNWDRTQAFAPRNMNAEQWGTSNMNVGYRFLPGGGASLLQSTQLLLNGRPLGSGIVRPGADGELEVEFDNVCPAAAANTYVLQAVYNGCNGGTLELYDTIYVNKTNSLTATATADPAFCTSSTGSITVTVPTGAGVPPLEYSLNGGPFQTSNVFNNLPAGNYTVRVRDASICNDVISVRVPSINNLAVSLDITPTSCNTSADGSITVNADRAVLPVSYSINGGPPQPSNVFSNLAPGTYFITVRDAAGCVSSNNRAVVTAGPGLFASLVKTNITCFGANDGTITLSPPATGTPPFQYSLNGITYQTATTFTNLAAGNYLIRIRDSRGCTGDVFVFITEPQPLRLTTSAQEARCNGASDGVILVTPSGGTPPYQYSLDNITYQLSNSFTVAANTYRVYVKDANGCLLWSQVTVTEPALLTASSLSSNATCNGGADGTITVSASGGRPPYQYSIDGTNYQSSNVLSANPGTYTVYIRDAGGCLRTITSTVGLTNNLTIAPMVNETICEGDSVQLSPQTNATAFSWSPTASLSGALIKDPFAFPRTTTDYILTATLGRCTASDTVTVFVRPAPVPNAGPDGDICFGQSFTLQGSGGINYTWSPSLYLNNTSIANPVSKPDTSIQYTLKVKDVNGCNSLLSDNVMVRVTPPIKVTLTPDTIVAEGETFMLQARSGGTNYSWSPSTGLSNNAVANPLVTVQQDITYTVTVTTSAGCKGEASIDIKVFKGPEIYVPTAFTPNHDGRNDTFYPFPVGIKELTYFKVYNRWGQLVFSTSKTMHGWDGKVGGVLQPTGVYVWMAEGITKDGGRIAKKGVVTLLQ